jgi:carboxymethylenebutenolidase
MPTQGNATQEHEIGFLAHPASGAPGVVMIPDVWGLSELYRGLARRLADAGFATLAIDPYRKTGAPELTDPASAMAWIRQLSDPVVLETIQEAIDFLARHEAVAGRPIGITGFCMGGQYAILAACSCRGLSACVPFYGMLRYEAGIDGEKKPRSPLDSLVDLTCPVLALYGEEDPIIPVADVRVLEDRLAAGSHPADVKLYAGAGHAFMNDARPEMYRPEAARDAWSRLVPFFTRHLR